MLGLQPKFLIGPNLLFCEVFRKNESTVTPFVIDFHLYAHLQTFMSLTKGVLLCRLNGGKVTSSSTSMQVSVFY